MNFQTVWPESRKQQLRELALQELTAKEIAEQIGKSRNAVLGMCDRLGIKLHGSRIEKKPKPERKPRTIKKLNWRTMAFSTPLPCPKDGRTTLLEAKEGQCRFILGEPHYGIICADRSVSGKSYCHSHSLICFGVRSP
jgi:hypothetical protein